MQKYFDYVIATITNSPSPKTLRIVRLYNRLISQDYSDKISWEVPIVLTRSESSLSIEAGMKLDTNICQVKNVTIII